MDSEFPISPYKNFCNGYGSSGNESKRYVLGVTLGIGISEGNLSHQGSKILDETNAFDLAEIDGPYIGQLNMSVVSSFCGPQGYIWGYDIANNLANRTNFENLGIREITYKNKTLTVFNGNFLLEALSMLFGTVDDKKYHILPGSHVPFASKNVKLEGEGVIYSSIALGIPKDRKKDACLLMEDIGLMNDENDSNEQREIILNLAKSVVEVGLNQKVDYAECLILFKCKRVEKGKIGCALVAAPYFTIAQDVVPKNIWGGFDFERLSTMDLSKWSNYFKK